jgi:adenine phosphoribosyltransferase
MNLLDYLTEVPNFPKPGILFRDISPLLGHPEAFKQATHDLLELANSFDCSHFVGIESRGFIFAAAMAVVANKPLVLVRKPNKLPLASHRESYGLEYGSDALEIQSNSLPQDAKVLLVDDVLATGGTFLATKKLVERVGATAVGAVALAEIEFLTGKQHLKNQGLSFEAVLKI